MQQAKKAEDFPSVQRRYTSFVKQAAFNYPLNTVLIVNMNLNEKLICAPAGISHSEPVISRGLAPAL